MIIPFWLRISSFRGEDFGFPPSLGLILLDLLILVNAIHELTHILGGFHSQGFSQVVFYWEPNLEGPDGPILKIPINFIKCLPVSVIVGFKCLPLSRHHGQQRV